MRSLEQDFKTYLKSKLVNIKEDILRKGQKVK